MSVRFTDPESEILTGHVMATISIPLDRTHHANLSKCGSEAKGSGSIDTSLMPGPTGFSKAAGHLMRPQRRSTIAAAANARTGKEVIHGAFENDGAHLPQRRLAHPEAHQGVRKTLRKHWHS